MKWYSLKNLICAETLSVKSDKHNVLPIHFYISTVNNNPYKQTNKYINN